MASAPCFSIIQFLVPKAHLVPFGPTSVAVLKGAILAVSPFYWQGFAFVAASDIKSVA